MRLLLFLLCLFSHSILFAQKNALKDTAAINAQLRAAKELLYEDLDKSAVLIEEALKASEKLDYKLGQAMAHHYQGRISLDTGAYVACINQQKTAISLAKGIDNQEKLLAACNNLQGIASENQGHYKQAIASYLKAIRLFETLKDSVGMCNVFNNIGLVHNAEGNHERADKYYRRAFDLASQMGDEFLVVTTRNNMGLSLVQQKRYEEARKHFEVALDFDLKDGNAAYIGGSYNNLATCNMNTGKYELALEQLDLAAGYKKEAGDKYGLTITLINKAQVLTKLRRFTESEQVLDSSRYLSVETGAMQHLAETFQNYSVLFDSLGDYKKSLQFYRQHRNLLDSLQLVDQRLEIERLQTEYNVEKKDLEINNQQVRLERQNFQLKGFVIALVLISLTLLVLSWAVVRIRKLNQTLKENHELLEEKNKLLNQTNEKLTRARDQAVRSSRAKSIFLSNVSHEIRTPMNVIMGLTQLLEDEKLSSKGKQNLGLIQQSSNHLLHIINDILDLSKIEAGKISFDDSRFYLPDVFTQLQNSMQTLIGNKPVSLSFIWPEDLPDYFSGDRTRLQQILTNLVGNAIKFTEKGSVKLEVKVISDANSLYTFRFIITDTGIGIPPSRINSIFDSFTQAEEDHGRVYGGTGLGLTITKKLVELQGGKITVESMPDEGSVFTVELNYLADSPSYIITSEKKDIQDIDFSQIRILLVEDNLLNISLATQLFKKWKAIYAVAENGYQALNQLKLSNFDIILLDLHMPGLNGFDTFREIRKAEVNTPVIALTADAFDDTRDEVHQMGFNDLLIKPYRADDLARMILKQVKMG